MIELGLFRSASVVVAAATACSTPLSRSIAALYPDPLSFPIYFLRAASYSCSVVPGVGLQGQWHSNNQVGSDLPFEVKGPCCFQVYSSHYGAIKYRKNDSTL